MTVLVNCNKKMLNIINVMMMPTIITINRYIIKLYMIMIIEMEILSFSLPESVMEKCSVDLTFEFVKKNLQFK